MFLSGVMVVANIKVDLYTTIRFDEERVFEIPSEKYSAEAIVRTLFDPKIDEEKICKKRPLNIQSSSTYVVNLDSLQHRDDGQFWSLDSQWVTS